jgi:hypothetical protein
VLRVSLALAQPAEPIREVWRRPQAGIESLAVAPDGSRCALVTGSGEVICWTGGRLTWHRAVRGAEAVALGSDGRAAVFTPLDLLHRGVLILDPQGKVTAHLVSSGPITQLAFSPDGRHLAIGTAGGTLEIYAPGGHEPAHHIGLRGSIDQLEYEPAGDLVVTTSAPARLSTLNSAGRLLWSHPAPAGCEFRIGSPPRAPGERAPLVAAVAPSAPGEEDLSADSSRPDPDRIDLIAFSAAGKPVWRNSLPGRDPHLGVLRGSGSLVVAYERVDRRGVVLRYDKSMACFRSDGSLLWQQGGMLYEPMLVCASAMGDTVLSLGTGNRFWLLSSRGQTLWSYTAGAPIRLVRASADGTAVAVATRDNYLSFLKISPGTHPR